MIMIIYCVCGYLTTLFHLRTSYFIPSNHVALQTGTESVSHGLFKSTYWSGVTKEDTSSKSQQ